MLKSKAFSKGNELVEKNPSARNENKENEADAQKSNDFRHEICSNSKTEERLEEHGPNLKESSKFFMNSLNEDQLFAIQNDDGPLAILATAGSGKTRTIVAKIAHLIQFKGVTSDNILAITFTREATREMRDRVEKIIGSKCTEGMTITNFHQICLKIVKDNFSYLGFSYPPIVLGAFEQREVVKICLINWIRQSNQDLQSIIEESSQYMEGREFLSPEAFLSIDDKSKNSFSSQFSGYSQTLKIPEKVISYFISSIANIKDGNMNASSLTDSQVYVFKHYVSYLNNMTAIDFSDMIPLCIKLFEQRPLILAKYQQKYRYILCDEFQDVSNNQFQFLRLLSEVHTNICVVGDDDQTVCNCVLLLNSNILDLWLERCTCRKF
jgi:DNA helicase-2/ATP-dependent DNA helicase PcrA